MAGLLEKDTELHSWLSLCLLLWICEILLRLSIKQVVMGGEHPHWTSQLPELLKGSGGLEKRIPPPFCHLRYPLAFQAASSSTVKALVVFVAFGVPLVSVLLVRIPPPRDYLKGNLLIGTQNSYIKNTLKFKKKVLWKLGIMTNFCDPRYLGNRGSRPSQVHGLPWHLEKPYHPAFKWPGDVVHRYLPSLGLIPRAAGKCCEVLSLQKGRR